MTPQPKQPYRKLPGHLRLLFGGSSFWAGDDHFLLVRSSRFSEQYKRFFYSDIQGIAIANAPRFHVSTRAIALGALWLMAVILTTRWPMVRNTVAWAGLIFPVAWLLVSALGSCRCRIYTAVSNDELPSVYRRWKARQFLAAVEPLIAARQGAVPANWAEIAEQNGVGLAAPGVVKPADTGAPRTVASDWLVASLFLAAAIELVHWAAVFERWTSLVAVFSILGGAVAVMVHRRKGLLQSAMQTLAVVTLIAMGLASYGRIVVTAGMASYKAAQTKTVTAMPIAYSEPPSMRPYAAGVYGLLGIVGIVLSLRSSGTRPARPVD